MRKHPSSSTVSLTLLLLCVGFTVSNAFVVVTPSSRPGRVNENRRQGILFSNEHDDHPGPTTLFNLQQPFEDLLLSFDRNAGGKSAVATNNNAIDDNMTTSGRSSLMLLSSALAPVAEILENTTDGWALRYADLRPESEDTVIGRSFLATNVAYAAVGFLLSSQGEFVLGIMTELVSVASFCYHYTQLQQPYNRTDVTTVKLALTVDYLLAVSSILVGLVYLVMDQTLPPLEVVATSTLGIGCLLACWIWEKGYPYIVLHSLWHIFSAATAYSIGVSHATNA
jgi:hypothetical protein